MIWTLTIAFTLILKYYYIRYGSGSSFLFPYVCIGSTAFESTYAFPVNCDDIEPEINISINRLIHTRSNSFILPLKNCSAAPTSNRLSVTLVHGYSGTDAICCLTELII